MKGRRCDALIFVTTRARWWRDCAEMVWSPGGFDSAPRPRRAPSSLARPGGYARCRLNQRGRTASAQQLVASTRPRHAPSSLARPGGCARCRLNQRVGAHVTRERSSHSRVRGSSNSASESTSRGLSKETSISWKPLLRCARTCAAYAASSPFVKLTLSVKGVSSDRG